MSFWLKGKMGKERTKMGTMHFKIGSFKIDPIMKLPRHVSPFLWLSPLLILSAEESSPRRCTSQMDAHSFLFLLLCVGGIDIFASLNPPIFGFWHVGVVGPYAEVLEDQLSQIENAVFVTNFTIVRIMSSNQSRTDVESLFRSHAGSKKLGHIMFTYGSEEEGRDYADTRTSWMIRSHSEFLRDDAIVWFIHNKGASRHGHPDYPHVTDWRRMMMYFLFEKEWCVTALSADFYDTCGSNLQYGPQRHYSGTFWMAHSRYIKTLPYATRFWTDPFWGERFAGEFWILHSSLDHSRTLCVHESSINMYNHPYPRLHYSHSPIGHQCFFGVKPEFLNYLTSKNISI